MMKKNKNNNKNFNKNVKQKIITIIYKQIVIYVIKFFSKININM